MTAYSQDNRSWHSDQRYPPFWNVSGEVIPAYAAIRISGKRVVGAGGTALEGSKPDGSDSVVAVNGPSDVQINRSGRCTLDWPATVLSDSTGEIGPVSGSFVMSASGSGYRVIGGLTSGKALVSPIPSVPSEFKPSYMVFTKIMQFTGPTSPAVPDFQVLINNGDTAYFGWRAAAGAWTTLPIAYDDTETDVETNGNMVVTSDFDAIIQPFVIGRLIDGAVDFPFVDTQYFDDDDSDLVVIPIAPLDFNPEDTAVILEYKRGAAPWSLVAIAWSHLSVLMNGERDSRSNVYPFSFVAGDLLRLKCEIPLLGLAAGSLRVQMAVKLLILQMNQTGNQTLIGVQP